MPTSALWTDDNNMNTCTTLWPYIRAKDFTEIKSGMSCIVCRSEAGPTFNIIMPMAAQVLVDPAFLGR
jgi:hypothetical protein